MTITEGEVQVTTFAEALKASIGAEDHFEVRDVLITPQDAYDILEQRRLPKERILNGPAVQKYLRDMQAGEFYGRLHTIKFGHNDVPFPIQEMPEDYVVLFDGQHRLRGCVLLGEPITINVMFNVPEHEHAYIDTARARRLYNQLGYMGLAEATTLDPLIGRARAWLAGNRTYRGMVTPTPREAEEAVRNDSSLEDAAKVGKIFYQDQLATQVALAFAYWVIMHESRQDDLEERVVKFFNDLHKGANLSETDPVHVLRERLRKDYAKSRPNMRRTHGQIHMILNAWNHRVEGEEVEFYRVPQTPIPLPRPR
jgi:hypothetical protein